MRTPRSGGDGFWRGVDATYEHAITVAESTSGTISRLPSSVKRTRSSALAGRKRDDGDESVSSRHEMSAPRRGRSEYVSDAPAGRAPKRSRCGRTLTAMDAISSALTRIACPASDMATLPLREARTDATPLIGADEAQTSVAPTSSTSGTTVALAPASSSQLVVGRRAVAKHQGAALT